MLGTCVWSFIFMMGCSQLSLRPLTNPEDLVTDLLVLRLHGTHKAGDALVELHWAHHISG